MEMICQGLVEDAPSCDICGQVTVRNGAQRAMQLEEMLIDEKLKTVLDER